MANKKKERSQDEKTWVIRDVDEETRTLVKTYAAMRGLTTAEALKRLVSTGMWVLTLYAKGKMSVRMDPPPEVLTEQLAAQQGALATGGAEEEGGYPSAAHPILPPLVKQAATDAVTDVVRRVLEERKRKISSPADDENDVEELA